ncbi:MAG: hypothetical protein ACK5Y2_13195 [Bdellovibrionales bacterium]
MKHIQSQSDWFYEIRPYAIIGIGVAGFLAKVVFPAGSSHWGMLCFLSSAVLVAAGAFILSARKDYRKANTWMR